MRACIAAHLFLASLAPYYADSAPTIHYSLAGNFEHIGLKLIDGARHEIGLVGYVLGLHYASRDGGCGLHP
jgi:hypothetical protein